MAQLKERTEERETTVIAGHVYDAETGEYIEPAERQGFAVTNESEALWLSEKINGFDADIKAIELRKQSIIANCDTQQADIERARSGMLWKYGKQLEDFARANLPHGKKTYTNDYLSVAFRTTRDRVVIDDQELALAWAKKNCEEAIKTTEKVMVSLLPSEVVADVSHGHLLHDGFSIVEGGETVRIETGIE